MALHLLDAINNGARDALVRTVDTDVIIILVGLFSNFPPEANILDSFWTISTLSVKPWGLKDLEPYLSFMHSQGVIPHHSSLGKQKRQPGALGCRTKMLQVQCGNTIPTSYFGITKLLSTLRVLCMMKAVPFIVSMN